jgi:hypothetical protein
MENHGKSPFSMGKSTIETIVEFLIQGNFWASWENVHVLGYILLPRPRPLHPGCIVSWGLFYPRWG